MKKLTLLLALIVCVTVGSVYAAWIYTGTSLDAINPGLTHGMTTATTDAKIGTLAVVDNGITIEIDQATATDYHANLLISGSITVSFTPNLGAPEEVVNNAVPAQMTILVTNPQSYDETPIYKLNTPSSVDLVWEKQTDGSFLATVSASQIDAILDLGGEFVLDTHAKYQAFDAQRSQITLTAQFSQK